MSDAPLLDATGLALRFGAIPALDDVALEIFPGEVVAIVGIFHDTEVRERVADRRFDVSPLPEAA